MITKQLLRYKACLDIEVLNLFEPDTFYLYKPDSDSLLKYSKQNDMATRLSVYNINYFDSV